MSRRRVVITGMGTYNPIAHDVATYWRELLAGTSGIGPITQIGPDLLAHFKTRFGGEVKNFPVERYMDSKKARRLDRFAQMGLAASVDAAADAGLDFGQLDSSRCGCIIGSGIGGLSEFEAGKEAHMAGGPRRISPFVIPKMMPNAAAGSVSIELGLEGTCTAVSTACASAANAITDAMHVIRRGEADVMVAGGSEAGITIMALGGFCSAQALSDRNDAPTKASRPFDRDRDGFVLSEGVGILILEDYEFAKARGARIHAEMLGSGSTADAHHITAPHPEGRGAARAMAVALRDAGLNPEQIDYINAHGTSTPLGDQAETTAIKAVFGEHAYKLAVSSTKSMIGHLLGASGGVELIATILCIKHGVIHPTTNYDNPDPKCDLDYVPNQPRERKVRYAISNSFGFGGHNCTLAVGAFHG